MRDRELTFNGKLSEMRARRAASGLIMRGELVYVFPDRGPCWIGLCVDLVPTEHYGLWYDILHDGRVQRIDEERVSLWDGPPRPRDAPVALA